MIHAANWLATELRHCIVARPSCPASPSGRPTSPSSPTTRDKDLGVSQHISEFKEQVDDPPRNRRPSLFQVPGDAVEPFFSEQESSPATSPVDEAIFLHGRPSNGRVTLPAIHSTHSEYFGIYDTTAELSKSSLTSKWTRFPPLRFGVEFWDLDLLREKNRLHSQTVWYAGSLFNVYTLVVRKKDAAGFQLGIYLHRQSSVESVPLMSIPSISSRHLLPLRHSIAIPLSESNGSLTSEGSSSNSSITQTIHLPNVNARARLSINADGTGTFSRGPSPATSRPVTATASLTPSLAQAAAPGQPYRDPRALISAYFTISCAGPSGSSITKFSSAPDVFGVGQSWGWKTSSFKSEEFLQAGLNGQPKKSLRATVTLGLV